MMSMAAATGEVQKIKQAVAKIPVLGEGKTLVDEQGITGCDS